ncbi:MAG: teichoic acid biosynthesis protein [Rhodocyclales bacterium]|nr:teichoic acid biosynthesis protein [Rhodocyclales bacterium]
MHADGFAKRVMKSAAPPDFERRVYCLLGLPIDALGLTEAVGKVEAAVATRTPCFISTPNLNFLMASTRDEAFRDSVIDSDLSLADGMPLVWISKLLGLPIRQRVAGSDLFERLRRGSASIKVFFFGGPDGVAERACERLNEEAMPMRCVGFASPGFVSVDAMSAPAQIDAINATGADFVVAALGAKKGQAWITRNRANVDAPVISHLGAVVNFVAGSVSRAPPVFQRLGLEWAWRIKEEPELWRRYADDGFGLLGLLFKNILPGALANLLAAPNTIAVQQARVSLRPDIVTNENCIGMTGAWTDKNLSPLRGALALAVTPHGNLRLDMEGVVWLDNAAIALLILLYGHQKRHGLAFQVSGAARSVRRALCRNGAGYLLDGVAPASPGQGNGKS